VPIDEPKGGGPRGARPQAWPGRLARLRRPKGVPAAEGIPESELAVRRDRLAAQFAELQWDLGGLVYEMAARDHFRLDVVMRQAAKLQAVDAELAEAERLLRLEEAGAAGSCPACGALHARGAAYCWQCGKDLMARVSAPGGTGTAPPDPSATLAAKVASARSTEDVDPGGGSSAPSS
jgi:hypothetical protein